jgi:hypothetical protein
MFFIFSFCSKSDVCYWNFLLWMQLQNSKVLILISWSEEVKLHYGMQKLTDLAPFLSLECRCQNAAWRPLVPWSLYHILLVVIYFLWVCNVSFLNIFICEIIFSYFCSSWNAIKFHYLWNWLSSVMNFCWVAYRKRKTSSIRLTELPGCAIPKEHLLLQLHCFPSTGINISCQECPELFQLGAMPKILQECSLLLSSWYFLFSISFEIWIT